MDTIFVFCWMLKLLYDVSGIFYSGSFFRLLFMDVAAGLKILELTVPTLQLWVPQVVAAFMTVFQTLVLPVI